METPLTKRNQAVGSICHTTWQMFTPLWLLWWLGLPTLLSAQTTLFAPAEQFLLLKNDRVMIGQVEPQGANFLIQIAESSQVFVPKDQVLFVGTSLRDLYDFKLRGMMKPNTGDHFKLTRWCMANGLLDEAVAHYRQVSQSAGDHPRVKQLAVELKDQLLKVAEFREYLGLPPIPRPGELGNAVLAAAATQVVGEGAAVLPAGGTRQPPPPQEVVTRFSERVQPILLNRCSQSACHGGQTKTPLRLLEPHPRFGTQTSADNLRNVLAYVPADAQTVSPLIDYATRGHGLRRTASIDITETQLMQELRDWIQLVQNPVVSAEAAMPTAATKSNTESMLSPVARGSEPRPVPSSTRAATLDQWQTPGPPPPVPVGIALPNPDGTPAAAPNRTTGEPSILLPGARTTSDPFDPTAFNQRVHGSGSADPMGSPAGG